MELDSFSWLSLNKSWGGVFIKEGFTPAFCVVSSGIFTWEFVLKNGFSVFW